MSVRVAINGFGRTGRAMFRAAHESEADIEWVAINDVADTEMLAQLLRHDTIYGPFPGAVEAADGALSVDGRRIETPSASDPAALDWEKLGADVVVESTGRFRARADAEKHLAAGAEKVIISAPAKDPDVTVALADHDELTGILAYSEEPLVSSDIVKSVYSSIFDAGLTAVIDGTQVKVVAWYDNEWGYSNRLVDLAQRVLVPVAGLRS
jgi:glyceraldehyde-3-phosphate dehydrogenase/erythrose-4-phosphate dehydrogenase